MQSCYNCPCFDRDPELRELDVCRGQFAACWEPTRGANPEFGNIRQLYCRTGWILAIHPNGVVRGTNELYDKHGIIEFVPTGYGETRILGLAAGLYVSMDNNGKLFGQEDPSDEGTLFYERVVGDHNIYLSRKYAHFGWHLGIKKSGKPKAGKLTWYNQKAVQFIARVVKLKD